MTHYMGLLVANSPWNLLMFMAAPVVLAETVAVTELILLFTRKLHGLARWINRIAGTVVGLYFLGVFVYLLINAVVPITTAGEWRGPADTIAVGFYLSGVIPLLGISLLEFGLIGKKRDETGHLKLHATLVGMFLVVAHVAMIFGMMNPAVLGYTGSM
jgi:hypothetical protein